MACPPLIHQNVYKASALWADAFYKSKCLSVCLSICLCVRLFTFEVLFTGLSESLGKINGKIWSNIWTFLFGSGLKSPRKNKFFFADFSSQNMVETTLPDWLETSGRRVYR